MINRVFQPSNRYYSAGVDEPIGNDLDIESYFEEIGLDSERLDEAVTEYASGLIELLANHGSCAEIWDYTQKSDGPDEGIYINTVYCRVFVHIARPQECIGGYEVVANIGANPTCVIVRITEDQLV